LKLYVVGLATTEKPGAKESTVEPLESTSVAVGVPVAMASLILLTPGVMEKEPEEEPIERLSVYVPTEKTTA
jgi:hypothetical protein